MPATTIVALVGGLLLDGDDEVAVEDALLDHRVAAHPEHEQVAFAGEVERHREQFFDVLLSQHVGAGGDVADQGNVAHRAAFHDDAEFGSQHTSIARGLDGSRRR